MAASWNTMPKVKVHWWKVTSYIILATLLARAHTVPRSKSECATKYDKIKKAGCSTLGRFSQQQALAALKHTPGESNMSLYLTSVIVNLTQVEHLDESLQPKENDTFEASVFLGGSPHGISSTFSYTPSLNFSVYRALLNPPVRVDESTKFQFAVHLNGNNWHPANISSEHLLSTTYIDVVDFCTEGKQKNCSQLVDDMYNGHPECGYIDEFDFIPKYWYCRNNSAPIVTTRIANITWEAIRNKPDIGRYVLIYNNSYVHDPENGTLDYHLVRVVYKTHSKRAQNISFTSQDDCTSSILTYLSNTTAPDFCINKSNGAIYATKTFIETVESIDDFDLSIRVHDFDLYPARMLTTHLILNSVSVCRKQMAAYRVVEDLKCHRISYNVTMIRARGDRPGPVRKVKLNTSAIRNIEEFYISGIRGKNQSVWNNVDEGYPPLASGNLKITVELPSQSQRAVAMFYQGQTGQYVPFVPPIRYKVGQVLNVKRALEGSEMMTLLQEDVANDFQLDQWTILLIEDKKNHSYCSEKKCVDNYEIFAGEYFHDPQVIKCENYDTAGYDAKYGYCKEPRIKGTPMAYTPTTITPRSTTKRFKAGERVIIKDCRYESQLEASDMYWLHLDSNKRLNVTGDIIPAVKHDHEAQVFKVPDYEISHITIREQGLYECVVVDRGRTVRSSQSTIKIKGNAIYHVSMTLLKLNRMEQSGTEWNWTTSYARKTSSKYVLLEENVTKSVNYFCIHNLKLDCTVEVQNFTQWPEVHTKNNRTRVRANLVLYMNTTPKKCVDIRDSNFTEHVGNFTIADWKVTNFDCCNPEDLGDDNNKGRYHFSFRKVTDSVSVPCKWHNPNNKKRFTRTCMYTLAGAQWSQLDLSLCKTRDESTGHLSEIGKKKVTKENAAEIANDVSNLINDSKALENPYNVQLVSNIIDKVIGTAPTDKKVVKNVIRCIGSIVVADKSAISNSSTQILGSLEKIALAQKPSEPGNFTRFTSPHLALGVLKPYLDKTLSISSKVSGGEIGIHFEQEKRNIMFQLMEGDSDASIFMPKQVVQKTRDSVIYSYVFQHDSLFPSGNDTRSLGYVMSASVGNQTIANLSRQNRIKMEFAIQQPLKKKEKGTTSCKFWKPDTSGKAGDWSTEGCQAGTGNTIPGRFHCLCNHLTNFGIFFDVAEQGDFSNETLDMISTVGCIISIVGLVLTIISNLMFKDVRKKVPSKILVNLSLALLATLIIFVSGVKNTQKKAAPATVGCRVVATLLQYFLLATFFWMAIEGVNLYRNFVKVFTGGSNRNKFLRICYLVGWGGPLLITVPTAAVRWENMGPATAKDKQFCVVQHASFQFAVIVPICIILVVNYILLVLVLHGIHIHGDTSREKSKKMRKVRIAAACATLLGSTWVLAFFSTIHNAGLHVAFNWIFAITNSLQGFFLFYFYTFTNNKIREGWKAIVKSNKKSVHAKLNYSQVSKGTTNAAKEIAASNVTLTSKLDLTERPVFDSTTDTLDRSLLDTSKSSTIPKFPQFKTKRADGKRANGKTT